MCFWVYDGFVFCLLLIWILGFEGNRVDCLFLGLGLSSKWVQIEFNLEMNLDLCLSVGRVFEKNKSVKAKCYYLFSKQYKNLEKLLDMLLAF